MALLHTKPDSWLRRWVVRNRPAGPAVAAKLGWAEAVPIAGLYGPLHVYLRDRYANEVVLTLTEMEDILGFALPPSAHHDPHWWANDDRPLTTETQSRPWILADRIATPHLAAHIVSFERRPE
jgi:hypothetical protein